MPITLIRFHSKMIFSPKCQKKSSNIKFLEYSVLESGMFDEDREKDGLIDMKNLIVTFRNFCECA
jgi:hypothetical protein